MTTRREEIEGVLANSCFTKNFAEWQPELRQAFYLLEAGQVDYTGMLEVAVLALARARVKLSEMLYEKICLEMPRSIILEKPKEPKL